MSRALAASLAVLMLAGSVRAADWTPPAWAEESTLELGTNVPDEGEHWFKVWLVVLDDQLYVRLGTRAAERVEQSSTRPYVGVRVAGHTFPRVRAEPAPERVGGVADAMAKKYWSDSLIHFFPHPLTLRLMPE